MPEQTISNFNTSSKHDMQVRLDALDRALDALDIAISGKARLPECKISAFETPSENRIANRSIAPGEAKGDTPSNKRGRRQGKTNRKSQVMITTSILSGLLMTVWSARVLVLGEGMFPFIN